MLVLGLVLSKSFKEQPVIFRSRRRCSRCRGVGLCHRLLCNSSSVHSGIRVKSIAAELSLALRGPCRRAFPTTLGNPFEKSKNMIYVIRYTMIAVLCSVVFVPSVSAKDADFPQDNRRIKESDIQAGLKTIRGRIVR